MGLMAGDLLGFAEVLEVFMIHANFDSVLHAEEEWVSTFESKDNHSQFLIIDVIVLLSGLEATTVEADRVNAISEFLGDDSSKGIPRGIGFEDESSGPVRGVKDGGRGADVFEGEESILFSVRPRPLVVLACKVVEWLHNIREVGDKCTIEIAET
jgi:hypothetical protein